MIYNVEKLGTINIGRHGENLARVIEIDVSSMLKQWPDATITLLVKRNKDEAPYVAVTELVDGVLYWPVTRAETAVPGNGLIEIRATCGETIAKSVTGFIRVSSALTGNETEPPETAKSWVDQVIEYGNEATQAAIKAKEEADRLSGINAKAVTLPERSEATVTVEDGRLVYGIPKGDKGDPGNDGYTPVKGVDYFDGEPGKDGTDATVTKDSIKTALGYTPADDADMAGKLTEPSTGLAVGKYFRIAAIDDAGHAVLEAVDAPVGGVQDVLVAGSSVVADGVANVPIMKNNGFGVAKIAPAYGVNILREGQLCLMNASEYDVDTRISNYRCITPNRFDYAVKAAMCDGKGAAWTEAEQAAARERMGVDKAWVLKGTLTTDNKDVGVTVDLTDCSEIAIKCHIVATGNSSLDTNLGMLAYQISASGDRTSYVRCVNSPFGIDPIVKLYGAGDTTKVGANVTAYTLLDNHSVSDINKFSFGAPSVIKSCNIQIYAR